MAVGTLRPVDVFSLRLNSTKRSEGGSFSRANPGWPTDASTRINIPHCQNGVNRSRNI
jgi:hypothetical protein